MVPDAPPPESIREAVAVWRDGGLVAFPTETVYGLGADADSPQAVLSIFRAKGRPADHPVIAHVGSAEALDAWGTGLSSDARRLAQAFWPGPLTLIVARSQRAGDALTGGQPSVGLRCPSHPWARALLAAWCDARGDGASAIAAPSANRYGRISPSRAEHVLSDLGLKPAGVVDLILDGGPCNLGIESTIIDCSGSDPRILRPGSIRSEQIEQCLNRPVASVAIADASAPRASGRMLAHYAPGKPVVLLTRAGLIERALTQEEGLVLVLASQSDIDALPASPHRVARVLPVDPDACASVLYDELHRFDQGPAQVLHVVIPGSGPRWLAVQDRLERAAAGSSQSAPAQLHRQQ